MPPVRTNYEAQNHTGTIIKISDIKSLLFLLQILGADNVISKSKSILQIYFCNQNKETRKHGPKTKVEKLSS